MLRIAVLGDSFSAALQVDMSQTFWSILERELNACPAVAPQRVEVVNFGVDGYGTGQELLTLRHRAWKYSPDVVLLAMFSGNDIGDNTREIRRNDLVPYFLLENNDLVLDNSFRDWSFNLKLALGYDKLINKLNQIRLVQLIKEARRVLPVLLYRAQAGSAAAAGSEIFNDGLQHEVYAPPANPNWQKAWDVTEALIAETAKEAREGKAGFWLVLLTNGIQVDPDPKVREAFAQYLGVADLHYPNRRIGAFASRLDIPFVDLAGPLGDYAQANNVYLHGSEGRGHWNAEGHRLAGLEIARAMCQAFAGGPH